MTIQARLSAEPTALTAGTRDQLRLTLTAVNEGKKVVDPQLGRAQLHVNGTPSQVFSLAVGNGRRPEKWYALAPGDSVSMTWSTLGERLFPEPGEYTLVLSLDDQAADPVIVSVEP